MRNYRNCSGCHREKYICGCSTDRFRVTPVRAMLDTYSKEFLSSIRTSLVSPPIMFKPARDVLARRIVMRPMDHTAFRVPHILTVERYAVALSQTVNSWCQVDVVSNE